jgi:hypothetical protein
VPAGLTAALLAGPEAGAGVSAALVAATLRAATVTGRGAAAAGGVVSANVLALTEGVLRVMFLTKLKAATGIVLATAMVVGAGGWSYRTWAAEGVRNPGGRPTDRNELVAAAPAEAAQQGEGQTDDGYKALLKQLYDLLQAQHEKTHRHQVGREDPRDLLRQLQEQLERQQKEQKRLNELLDLLKEHLAAQHRTDALSLAAERRQAKALAAIKAALAELSEATRANPAQLRAVKEFMSDFERLQDRLATPPAPPPARQKIERPAGGSAEGVVREVSPEGLLKISIGSDDGVQPGQTLDVYRLKPEPKYLGKITVVSVTTHEAVAKVQPSNPGGAIREQDRVGKVLPR